MRISTVDDIADFVDHGPRIGSYLAGSGLRGEVNAVSIHRGGAGGRSFAAADPAGGQGGTIHRALVFLIGGGPERAGIIDEGFHIEPGQGVASIP